MNNCVIFETLPQVVAASVWWGSIITWLLSEDSQRQTEETMTCAFECMNDGICVMFMKRNMCNCKTGYTGDACQVINRLKK